MLHTHVCIFIVGKCDLWTYLWLLNAWWPLMAAHTALSIDWPDDLIGACFD